MAISFFTWVPEESLNLKWRKHILIGRNKMDETYHMYVTFLKWFNKQLTTTHFFYFLKRFDISSQLSIHPRCLFCIFMFFRKLFSAFLYWSFFGLFIFFCFCFLNCHKNGGLKWAICVFLLYNFWVWRWKKGAVFQKIHKILWGYKWNVNFKGPILLNPSSLISALLREVWTKNPEEFKISCLNGIKSLFPDDRPAPFYAGFGNKSNDETAYTHVKIPHKRKASL